MKYREMGKGSAAGPGRKGAAMLVRAALRPPSQARLLNQADASFGRIQRILH